jgi:phytoene dehydrogenase-like protein
VDKILEYKGNIKPNTTITEVHAAKKYVVDNNGNEYAYDQLIWAADLKTFYKNTKTADLDISIQEKFEAKKQQIMKGKGSESVFSLYLEADLPLSYFGEIANGHFFYTPSKQGLYNIHRGELKSMLDNWDSVNKAKIYSWLERFLKLNTFEISIPGLKNENLAPKNKTGLIISFIIDYDLFIKVKDSGWYDEFRSRVESIMIDVLSSSVYPRLKDHIEKHFSFTPISIENRVGSSDGAIVGWSFEEEIPLVNKIQYSDKSILTPIDNILQAGQWAYSPAGVPMSILTGKLAAERFCRLGTR